MTGWIDRRLRARGDRGAILVFALIIVTTVALVVGVVLTRGGGSLKATVALRGVAGASYAADSAANIAINNLRNGYGFSPADAQLAFNNNPSDGLGCFGHNSGVTGDTDNLILNGFYPAAGSFGPSSAYVHCSAQGGTGQQGPAVTITKDNKAAYALITLGGSITNTAGSPLKVHGGVYSNNAITGPVALDLGDAHAVNSCTDTTVVAPAVKDCNNHTPYVDPNYAADIASAPALVPLPTSCTGNVAVFSPGYYDDVVALNAAVRLCSASWFKPGTYYFDFHNGCVGSADYCPANVFPGRSGNDANVWVIPDGKPVIGGQRAGVFATSSQVVMTEVNGNDYMGPGNCVSPLTDTSALGVQFIFGADSQMHLEKTASMELCGSYHTDKAPIELFGLQASTPGVSTPSLTSETRDISHGGSVISSGAFVNADVAHLRPGGAGATWTRGGTTGTPPGTCCGTLDASDVTLTKGDGTFTPGTKAAALPILRANGTGSVLWSTGNSGASKTGSLLLEGFAPSAAVPSDPSLTVSSAKLSMAHYEPVGGSASVRLVVSGSGTATWTPPSWPSGQTPASNQISITGADLTSLQAFIRANGYTKATVTYSLRGGTAAADPYRVGQVKLELSLAWDGQSGDTTGGTTTLKVDGFAPSTSVPAGAILTGATVHVDHSESVTAGSSGSVTLGVGGWSYTSPTITPSTSLTTENLVVPVASLNALQSQIHANGYTKASVAYTAKAAAGTTTTLKSITLELKYYLPVLRAQSGCVTAPLAGGGCSFLWTDSDHGNNKVSLYMQGTTYVPKADVNLTLSNFGAQVLKFGLIARQMEFNINNGNPRYTGPVFQIPDNTFTTGFVSSVVQLEVHLCLGESTVSTDCKARAPALTSRVQFYDPTGVPVPFARQVTPLSWNHTR